MFAMFPGIYRSAMNAKNSAEHIKRVALAIPDLLDFSFNGINRVIKGIVIEKLNDCGVIL